ncbi:transposable element Tcb2 transposase [Trichonephila clavipes]|nr:transposable element Tcb2 transposase [Trichonephila clavipes]
MMEAGWSARRVACQLGRSGCAGPLCLLEQYEGAWLKYIWDRGAHPSTPPFRVVTRTRRNWTAVEWNQAIFSDESRFNLSSDDNRVFMWRSSGEHLNPALALRRHTSSTARVRCNNRIVMAQRKHLDDFLPGMCGPSWKYPRNFELNRVSSPGFGNDSKMMVM